MSLAKKASLENTACHERAGTDQLAPMTESTGAVGNT